MQDKNTKGYVNTADEPMGKAARVKALATRRAVAALDKFFEKDKNKYAPFIHQNSPQCEAARRVLLECYLNPLFSADPDDSKGRKAKEAKQDALERFDAATGRFFQSFGSVDAAKEERDALLKIMETTARLSRLGCYSEKVSSAMKTTEERCMHSDRVSKNVVNPTAPSL